MLTQSELKSALRYNKNTGQFVRLVDGKGPNNQKGNVAGTHSHPRGYIQISVKSKSYYAHRLAWLYAHGYMPAEIDHINGNTSDNRLRNLRECSKPQNMQNLKRAGNSKNKSGHIGVYQSKNKWRASIRYTTNDDKRIKLTIGSYESKKEAIAAYNAAKLLLHNFQPTLIR